VTEPLLEECRSTGCMPPVCCRPCVICYFTSIEEINLKFSVTIRFSDLQQVWFVCFRECFHSVICIFLLPMLTWCWPCYHSICLYSASIKRWTECIAACLPLSTMQLLFFFFCVCNTNPYFEGREEPCKCTKTKY